MTRLTPDEIRSLKQFTDEQRTATTPFDIVVGGSTPGGKHKQAAQKVRPFAEAGATWWLESIMTFSTDKLRARIKQGPPRVE